MHIHDGHAFPYGAKLRVGHLLRIATGTIRRLHIGFKDGAQTAWRKLFTLQYTIFIGDQPGTVGKPALTDQRWGNLPFEVPERAAVNNMLAQRLMNILKHILFKDARHGETGGVGAGFNIVPVKAGGVALRLKVGYRFFGL